MSSTKRRAMQIVDAIVSDGHGALTPEYVCIHETANPGATAAQHVSYWSASPAYAVHYVADWGQRVYRCVPDDRICWQVGGGNSHVLGIELCHATNSDDFAKVWDNGVEWAAWALSSRGWGVDRLISHDDARRMWGGTDHADPIEYFEQFGRSWVQFVACVAAELEGNSMTTEQMRELAKLVADYVNGYEDRYGSSLINEIANAKARADSNGRRLAALEDIMQSISDTLEELEEKIL